MCQLATSHYPVLQVETAESLVIQNDSRAGSTNVETQHAACHTLFCSFSLFAAATTDTQNERTNILLSSMNPQNPT